MSVDTVRTLTERHGADSASIWPEGLPEAFSFVDFPDFAQQFFYGLSLLRSGDDLATIADDLGEIAPVFSRFPARQIQQVLKVKIGHLSPPSRRSTSGQPSGRPKGQLDRWERLVD